MRDPRQPGTFSIVACDPERSYWGVAVATFPPSVGATCPWAEWKVGALTTQAWSNYSYGPHGLALLREGVDAGSVVRRLTRADRGRERRQLAVVDRNGRAAAWTGKQCHPHALHEIGDGYSVQGNLLAASSVVRAMARAFETTRGTLASRMMRALFAGAAEGGDRRGLSSSAMVVVHREPWLAPIYSDRWVDLRVDRSRRPLKDLERLLAADEADTRKIVAERERAARKRRRARSASRGR
jgi:uncharacterized Ntn-hydrolase superfamily protein